MPFSNKSYFSKSIRAEFFEKQYNFQIKSVMRSKRGAERNKNHFHSTAVKLPRSAVVWYVDDLHQEHESFKTFALERVNQFLVWSGLQFQGNVLQTPESLIVLYLTRGILGKQTKTWQKFSLLVSTVCILTNHCQYFGENASKTDTLWNTSVSITYFIKTKLRKKTCRIKNFYYF